ncbi:hypothetical protein QCI42_22775 [Bacillus fungorum]|uniref:hypothetical protein n=1 Tax=Bacillus fungorum TaxID=2039284 RepID=UPI003395F520
MQKNTVIISKKITKEVSLLQDIQKSRGENLYGKSLREIREQLVIKSNAQIIVWVKRAQQGESFDDQRGVWNGKNFNSLEAENAYLKKSIIL